MGATESKKDDNILFNEDERQKIREIYANICEKQFNNVDLLQFCQHILSPEISENLFKWMISHKTEKQREVSYQLFVRCLGMMLRGIIDDKSCMVLFLSAHGPTSPNGQQLVKFVEEMVKSFLKVISHTPEYQSWRLDETEESIHRFALFLLDDLFYTGPVKDKGMKSTDVPTTMFTHAHIEDWLSKSSTFLQILDQVFSTCFNIYSEDEMNSRRLNPELPLAKNIDKSNFKSLLDLPTLIYLNTTLPVIVQSEWRLLFSNHLYGDSFVQLVQRVLSQGPTITIIKDKAGHVFGGFASESWKKNSDFYGDDKCYLFQLKPHLYSYTPTGYNKHYLYFNQHVQTLPNGLGFGGQFDYFGLWIDHNFSAGHSKAGPRCTTYGSPQLSQVAEFEVDTVEVWAVGPEPKSEYDDDEHATAEKLASRKSILDKDPAAKAILSLIGKAPHSEGLREGDETADSPEEHTINTVISLF